MAKRSISILPGCLQGSGRHRSLYRTWLLPLDLAAAGSTEHRTVAVAKKEYPVQHLRLPKGMVELSPEDEARVERELKLTSSIWPNETGRIWDGGFINPREGKIVTLFGVRRFMNKIPEEPPYGCRCRGRSRRSGAVAEQWRCRLVDDLYYSGNSVVLDHGQGIYTMFFHLSKVLVKPGQQIKKGDVIALVGSTGRSTGAHLHWGVRIQGARVDPMELIKLDLDEGAKSASFCPCSNAYQLTIPR